jgi:hypothetical protein
MNPYRKPDQYYIDAYDRRTIKILKAVEVELTARLSPLKGKKWMGEVLSIALFEDNSFNDTGAKRNRNKRESIQKEMEADEQLDRLVASTEAPDPPTCATCNEEMQLSTHLFEEGDMELLFVFECAQHHSPRRALYSNGREKPTPISTCSKCGGNVNTTKQETDTHLIITDTCKKCKHKSILQIDRAKHDQPITEEDRNKYITYFERGKTYVEAMISLNKTFDEIRQEQKEQEIKELIGFDKIEKPTVHQLQQKITEAGEKSGFVALQLDKPEITRDTLLIGFTMQDSGDRKEEESMKAFATFIKEVLMQTSWRLHKKKIEYRMGYLSGTLQGFENEIDLMKIAEEIVENKKEKK